MQMSCSNFHPVRVEVKGFKISFKVGIYIAIVVAIATVFLPNRFRSSARILPVESKSTGSLGQLAAAAAAMGVGVPSTDSGDANFVEILGSRSIREKILQTEFHFRARSWRFGSETFQHTTLYNYIKPKNLDQGLRAMGKMLSVSRDIKTRIITISSETTSPELSQQIVQKAIQSLGEFVIEKNQTKGGQKARFAEARLKDAREEMATSEESLRRFLETNRNYLATSDPSVRLLGLRLESELKLRQQMVITLAMNREQAILDEKNDIPIVNIMDSANLPIEKSGPVRSEMVILAFLLAGAGTWLWRNRVWIKQRLLDDTSDLVVGRAQNKENV